MKKLLRTTIQTIGLSAMMYLPSIANADIKESTKQIHNYVSCVAQKSQDVARTKTVPGALYILLPGIQEHVTLLTRLDLVESKLKGLDIRAYAGKYSLENLTQGICPKCNPNSLCMQCNEPTPVAHFYDENSFGLEFEEGSKDLLRARGRYFSAVEEPGYVEKKMIRSRYGGLLEHIAKTLESQCKR